jgi:hypothetical protein
MVESWHGREVQADLTQQSGRTADGLSDRRVGAGVCVCVCGEMISDAEFRAAQNTQSRNVHHQ